MPKIITLTTNAAIDNLLEVNNFQIGGVFLTERSDVIPAGKGVNVARAIAALEVPVVSYAVVGEESKSIFDLMNSTYLQVCFLTVPGETRRNITILDTTTKIMTHLRNKGSMVTDDDIEYWTKELSDVVDEGDFLVISGSLPPGAKETVYYDLIKILKRIGAFIVLDTSGDAFKYALAAKPDVVKPNHQELEEFSGRKLSTDDELIEVAREINNIGVKTVLVSVGSRGVFAVESNSPDVIHAFIDQNADITKTKCVGSGDSFVAGFVLGLYESCTLQEALRRGVAFGAANLHTVIPGLVDPKIVKSYYEDSIVKKRVGLEIKKSFN